ncbi:hypothetical protein BN2475_250075 [Paraburkholderia ribeironis]|uniref:Uncharacterized protein n=1 Tax=Paraburkholderia ribeironis TaxID=1247936 RepID=A0A1N7RZT2_9BURK|nr:hypothetical protein BN2475_250075 [Paraburkholderia ribeironis]
MAGPGRHRSRACVTHPATAGRGAGASGDRVAVSLCIAIREHLCDRCVAGSPWARIDFGGVRRAARYVRRRPDADSQRDRALHLWRRRSQRAWLACCTDVEAQRRRGAVCRRAAVHAVPLPDGDGQRFDIGTQRAHSQRRVPAGCPVQCDVAAVLSTFPARSVQCRTVRAIAARRAQRAAAACEVYRNGNDRQLPRLARRGASVHVRVRAGPLDIYPPGKAAAGALRPRQADCPDASRHPAAITLWNPSISPSSAMSHGAGLRTRPPRS